MQALFRLILNKFQKTFERQTTHSKLVPFVLQFGGCLELLKSIEQERSNDEDEGGDDARKGKKKTSEHDEHPCHEEFLCV